MEACSIITSWLPAASRGGSNPPEAMRFPWTNPRTAPYSKLVIFPGTAQYLSGYGNDSFGVAKEDGSVNLGIMAGRMPGYSFRGLIHHREAYQIMKLKNQRAFTLIELLIVVAIIAVLAAIAVPNFLEAQTRARIVRSTTDMRAVALAIEAYTADNNQIPMAKHPITWTLEDGSYANDTLRVQGQSNHAGDRLLKPIAYMTEIPFDWFNSQQIDPKSGPYWGGLQISFVYWGDPIGGEDGKHLWFGEPGRWVMTSVGPNLFFDSGIAGDPLAQRYDPTNGTISRGLLLRWNGGRASPYS